MSGLREDWPYLTSMTDRAPRRKHHHSLEDAKRAVRTRIDGDGRLGTLALVYRWNDLSGWELLWRIPADSREEDLPWNKEERN